MFKEIMDEQTVKAQFMRLRTVLDLAMVEVLPTDYSFLYVNAATNY